MGREEQALPTCALSRRVTERARDTTVRGEFGRAAVPTVLQSDRDRLDPVVLAGALGADGLILYDLRDRGATMTLFNADGSASELSGNGLRCLAAFVARAQQLTKGSSVAVDTDAGVKTLELLGQHGTRVTFRAALGAPTDLRQVQIPVLGEIRGTVTELRVTPGTVVQEGDVLALLEAR